jgi:stage V sporulation protein SpoVS
VPAQRTIATAAVISVGAGSLNAVVKDKRLPSARFLIGSGVAFFLISALAEAEPETAQALAIAVTVTVLLDSGDGGGVLSYFNTGEMNTERRPRVGFTPRNPPQNRAPVATADTAREVRGQGAVRFAPDTVPAFPAYNPN